MRNATCVGASLLANTSGQAASSWMTQRFREQARSHRGGVYWLDRSHALRGHASRDAPRSNGTQSVPGCVPTRSVGTIDTSRLQMTHPTVGFHTIGKVFVYSEKVGAKASQP